MAGDTDIYSLPVSLMPYKTRKLLSCLLNSTKIIPSDGSDKLPRDWRGLAHFANIPSDIAASFHQSNDKTAKVLEEWHQHGSPTVGKLLEFMQRIDRYDVHDEILNDLQGYVQRGEIDLNQPYQIAIKNQQLVSPVDEEFSVITVDDAVGYEHQYHAFVLYADEDKDFVDELYEKMDGMFQICTKEKLLPGHATEYAPVAQLISKRCLHIILVCSPDFLISAANTFYRDYAQAVTIESKQHKIIPIMYKECQLPAHLMFYHKLYYTKEGRAMYDFWEKLRQTLGQTRPMSRLNGVNSSLSGLNITELPNSNGVSNSFTDGRYFLDQGQNPRSISMNGLNLLNPRARVDDGSSMSNYSHLSDTSVDKKKKVSLVKRIINNMKWKKSKNEVFAGPSSAM